MAELTDAEVDRRFDVALAFVKSLPADGPIKPSTEDQLKFYSFFKQATIGQCNEKQPSRLKVVQRFKWDAWNTLGKMSKREAKMKYVEALLAMAKRMPSSTERDKLLNDLESKAGTAAVSKL